MLIKSDVLVMTPDGSLYPGSADMLSTALIYLPNTLRFSYRQWMWKACRNEQHLLSKSQSVHENMGFAPSAVVWPCFSATWHSYHFGFKIFSHCMNTDSAVPTNRCRNLSAVLELCRALTPSNSLLMMLTKIFLDALTHSMERVILQTLYWVGPDLEESYS